jgi:hypothetical protein
MVFLRCFFQVDKKNGLYFFDTMYCRMEVINFALSNKTEVGSAGEQPARDSLMTGINNKINSRSFVERLFIFVLMPSKTHQ